MLWNKDNYCNWLDKHAFWWHNKKLEFWDFQNKKKPFPLMRGNNKWPTVDLSAARVDPIRAKLVFRRSCCIFGWAPPQLFLASSSQRPSLSVSLSACLRPPVNAEILPLPWEHNTGLCGPAAPSWRKNVEKLKRNMNAVGRMQDAIGLYSAEPGLR